MSGKAEDLTGRKYGYLTVIKRGENYHSKNHTEARWICKCDCGNEVLAIASLLKSGSKKSCGCMNYKSSRKYNSFETLDNNTVKVCFNNCNEYFVCDEDNWEKLKDHCWSKGKTGYAESRINGKTELFHHFVINCPDGFVRDHINRNKLDNRKVNLRVVTRSENNRNKVFKNKYGYRGIYQVKNQRSYYVRRENGRKTVCCKTLEEAIALSKALYGELSESK